MLFRVYGIHLASRSAYAIASETDFYCWRACICDMKHCWMTCRELAGVRSISISTRLKLFFWCYQFLNMHCKFKLPRNCCICLPLISVLTTKDENWSCRDHYTNFYHEKKNISKVSVFSRHRGCRDLNLPYSIVYLTKKIGFIDLMHQVFIIAVLRCCSDKCVYYHAKCCGIECHWLFLGLVYSDLCTWHLSAKSVHSVFDSKSWSSDVGV